MSRLWVLVVMLALVLCACAGSSSSAVVSPSPTVNHGEDEDTSRDWSYSGRNGPGGWQSLDVKFDACSSGSRQSPIDLANPTPASLGSIDFAYRPTPLVRQNHGHDIEVPVDPGSTMRFQGTQYELIRFHFHAPSEHTLNGNHFGAEIHMVNQTADGKTAVVTVFIGQGGANEAYGRVFTNLPAPKASDTGPDGNIDPTQLLPPEGSRANYYAYDGSLTTPPCTEGVKFLIFVAPVTVSPAQLGVLLAAYDHNSRPVQPLNGRVLQQSQ